jgi:hypothetical protein
MPRFSAGKPWARIVAWLKFRGGRFIDRDLDDAVRLALRGLRNFSGLISASEGSRRISPSIASFHDARLSWLKE